jgi:short-subunit dehydrogenase
MSRNFADTTALVTGASSGIGEALARTLAQRGSHLVLVARRQQLLDALAEDIRAKHGVKVTVLAKDLTDPASVASITEELKSRDITLDTLVNNAGFGMHGPLAESDAEKNLAQIQLNITSLVALTRQFLPELMASGRGGLINVASTAAFQPIPIMAIYGASKAFVLNFTEAIAYEARGSGLRVTALCPGATSTDFFDTMGTDEAAVGTFKTPQQVADLAIHALDARSTPPSIISGKRNHMLALTTKLLPRKLVLNVTGRMMYQGRR